VIHLEPPDHAVILFRVDGGEVQRIRTLSPDCEIDAGNLPVHWLNEVKPAESVTLLTAMAAQRDRYSDSAMTAIANHSDPAAEAALKRYLDPMQPSSVRVRAVGWFGNYRGRSGYEVLKAHTGAQGLTLARSERPSPAWQQPGSGSIDLLTQRYRRGSDPSSRIRMAAISALNRGRGRRCWIRCSTRSRTTRIFR
jgi:hypothetical protein